MTFFFDVEIASHTVEFFFPCYKHHYRNIIFIGLTTYFLETYYK